MIELIIVMCGVVNVAFLYSIQKLLTKIKKKRKTTPAPFNINLPVTRHETWHH